MPHRKGRRRQEFLPTKAALRAAREGGQTARKQRGCSRRPQTAGCVAALLSRFRAERSSPVGPKSQKRAESGARPVLVPLLRCSPEETNEPILAEERVTAFELLKRVTNDGKICELSR